MRVIYRPNATDDIIRQFRYYLLGASATEAAIRFGDAVTWSVGILRDNPFLGAPYPLRNRKLQNLRSWPVAGFDAFRIYYLPEPKTLRIVRILHQKRNVRRILEEEL